jgi:hypothetical protein
MKDKTDDSCNSTSSHLQPKLQPPNSKTWRLYGTKTAINAIKGVYGSTGEETKREDRKEVPFRNVKWDLEKEGQ